MHWRVVARGVHIVRPVDGDSSGIRLRVVSVGACRASLGHRQPEGVPPGTWPEDGPRPPVEWRASHCTAWGEEGVKFVNFVL